MGPAQPLLVRCTFPPPGTPLTCAVSGGADSLALLVLAVAAGCAVTAVHVDHGLRPGSAAEALVVAAAAERFGAAFESVRVTVPATGEAGPEGRARAARYAALPPDAATGHTMDDQAETVLLNVLRGAGLDGLGGMQPGWRHPILGLRRHETRALCQVLELDWVEDLSNADPAFLRNRVRAELLPLCAALAGRDPVPVLARQAGILREEAALLEALSAEAVPEPADARALAQAEPALARRAVRAWLRDVTAPAGPGQGRGEGDRAVDRHPPTLAEVQRVLAVASGEAVATEGSGGVRVRRRAGRLEVMGGPPTIVLPVARVEAALNAPVPNRPEVPDVPHWAQPGVGPVMIDEVTLAERVVELGQKITADYADHPPLLVGVLKGAMVFMSDLCRAIELPADIDFMAVSSYGSATRTSGVVRIVKDLDAELTDRHVLVVEDIIDSGLTLNYLRRYLQARSPSSLEVCALLVKDGAQRAAMDLRYVGFHIPNKFVVGYGLDVDERYRNLRGIHNYVGDSGSPEGGAASGTRGAIGGGGK